MKLLQQQIVFEIACSFCFKSCCPQSDHLTCVHFKHVFLNKWHIKLPLRQNVHRKKKPYISVSTELWLKYDFQRSFSDVQLSLVLPVLRLDPPSQWWNSKETFRLKCIYVSLHFSEQSVSIHWTFRNISVNWKEDFYVLVIM